MRLVIVDLASLITVWADGGSDLSARIFILAGAVDGTVVEIEEAGLARGTGSGLLNGGCATVGRVLGPGTLANANI